MVKQAIVVMGVAGCGKSTVGKALADALHLPFHDADEYHPESNIEKMKNGLPLTDADRWPWLETLSELLHAPVVLACSALRASYREILSRRGDPRFVFLQISPETATQRLRARAGHFMPSSLIESQFATLEAPVDAIVVDAEQQTETELAECLRQLGAD